VWGVKFFAGAMHIMKYIRTGYVYRIPKNSIKNIDGVTEFTLPVYDSPLLICDKDFLSSRKLIY
jgi:hypothetical protein